jgi:hypothetical protein
VTVKHPRLQNVKRVRGSSHDTRFARLAIPQDLANPGRGRLYPVVAGAMRGPGAVAHPRCSFRNVRGTVQVYRPVVGEAQPADRRLPLKVE